MIGKKPATPLDILQLMFIHLKLSGAIDWSWFMVFAPLASVAIISLVIYTLKETLTMLNNWLLRRGASDGETTTGSAPERGRLHQTDRDPEREWSDSQEDE